MKNHTLISIAAIFIILFGLQWASSFFGPLLFAFTLTLLIWPILHSLERNGMSRKLAITTVVAILILAFTTLAIIITSSMQQFSASLPYYTGKFNLQVQPILDYLSLYGLKIGTSFDSSTLVQTSIAFLTGFIGSLFSVFMFLLMLVFMVASSDSLVKKYMQISAKNNEFTEHFSAWTTGIQTQYRVQTISNLISGTIATLLFYFFGIDFAILWGVLIFLLAYIPNFGIMIASITPVLLAFVLKGWIMALVLIILLIILNITMDNVINPRLMGTRLGIPPIAILISFIFFGFIFGILGAFLAIPLLLALRQILEANPGTNPIAQLLGASKKGL